MSLPQWGDHCGSCHWAKELLGVEPVHVARYGQWYSNKGQWYSSKYNFGVPQQIAFREALKNKYNNATTPWPSSLRTIKTQSFLFYIFIQFLSLELY